jgi:hypothetical protein
MYGHLETRQLGNGFKYNENYIHNWKPHTHTRLISIAINIKNKIPSPNVVIHYSNLKFVIKKPQTLLEIVIYCYILFRYC